MELQCDAPVSGQGRRLKPKDLLLRGGGFMMSDRTDSMSNISFKKVKEALGFEFQNKYLLERALTRKAYAEEQKHIIKVEHQEDLATLGDAVLRSVLTELLIRSGAESKGVITEERVKLEKNETLGRMAKDLGLGDLMIPGRGEKLTGVNQNISALATTLEALIGAYHLDSDYQTIRMAISKLYRRHGKPELSYIY
jgi:ribonuclease-3